MKASDAISARATPPAAATDLPQPSPAPARRFGLTGPSVTLDPARHAYRDDVADIGLAGRVVASHYAEPFVRMATADTALLPAPGDPEDGERLRVSEAFAVLDCARGYAWGYRLSDHRVGYVDQKMLQSA